MLYKVIVLLLRTKQAQMLFIYYMFDDVVSQLYFMFMALTKKSCRLTGLAFNKHASKPACQETSMPDVRGHLSRSHAL